MLAFILLLLGMTVIQILLQLVLGYLGLGFVAITIIIDLVTAVIFTLFNFRGREKLRDPAFHRQIAIYFAVLSLMSVLMYYI